MLRVPPQPEHRRSDPQPASDDARQQQAHPEDDLAGELKNMVGYRNIAVHDYPGRVDATGLSLGGYGCWEIAKDYPGRFAIMGAVIGVSTALGPIVGGLLIVTAVMATGGGGPNFGFDPRGDGR